MKKFIVQRIYVILVLSILCPLIVNGQNGSLSINGPSNINTPVLIYNWTLVADSVTAQNLTRTYVSIQGPSGPWMSYGDSIITTGSIAGIDSVEGIDPNSTIWIKRVRMNDSIFESNVIEVRYNVPRTSWVAGTIVEVSGSNSGKAYFKATTFNQNTDIGVVKQAGDTIWISIAGSDVDTYSDIDLLGLTPGHIYNIQYVAKNAVGIYVDPTPKPFIITITGNNKTVVAKSRILVTPSAILILGSSKSGKYQIINLQGQIEAADEINGDKIDISNLNPGIYICKINGKTEEDNICCKFVVH